MHPMCHYNFQKATQNLEHGLFQMKLNSSPTHSNLDQSLSVESLENTVKLTQ